MELGAETDMRASLPHRPGSSGRLGHWQAIIAGQPSSDGSNLHAYKGEPLFDLITHLSFHD